MKKISLKEEQKPSKLRLREGISDEGFGGFVCKGNLTASLTRFLNELSWLDTFKVTISSYLSSYSGDRSIISICIFELIRNSNKKFKYFYKSIQNISGNILKFCDKLFDWRGVTKMDKN